MPILLDSSFIIAYANEADVHHKAAVPIFDRIWEGAWGTALIPEYVLTECLTIIAARKGLLEAVRWTTDLLRAEEVEFVSSSPFFWDTLEIFRGQGDTKLGFVDCSLLAVARERNVGNLATFDKGFRRVAGIQVVP